MITISILPFLKYLSFLKNKIREISSKIYIFWKLVIHIFYTFYVKKSLLITQLKKFIITYCFIFIASRRKIDHQSHERDKETLANAEDREGSGDGQGRSMRSASKGGESTRRKAEG